MGGEGHCDHALNLCSLNYKRNGYKLSAQRFLGSLGWTSVTYDWSMVFTAAINQSQAVAVQPNHPRNRCAESLYPIPFNIVSGVRNSRNNTT